MNNHLSPYSGYASAVRLRGTVSLGHKPLCKCLSIHLSIHQNCSINRYPDHAKHGITLLEKNISKTKSEDSAEKFLAYIIEKLAEHGMYCLPCSYTSDVIDLFQSNYDVLLLSK